MDENVNPNNRHSLDTSQKDRARRSKRKQEKTTRRSQGQRGNENAPLISSLYGEAPPSIAGVPLQVGVDGFNALYGNLYGSPAIPNPNDHYHEVLSGVQDGEGGEFLRLIQEGWQFSPVQLSRADEQCLCV